MKNLLVLAAFIFCCSALLAQAPEKMSYQAVLRDGSGKLVKNAQVGMRTSILKGGATGSGVFVETHTPSTNVNGLVTLQIGSGSNVSGSIDSIDWSDGPYFLKTETDVKGGTSYSISATFQMMSVPYAWHASHSAKSSFAKTAEHSKVADTVLNLPQDTIYWHASGNSLYSLDRTVGIGTSNPGLLDYWSHSEQTLTILDSNGAAVIELAGSRQNDGQSISWISTFNDTNRIAEMVVSRAKDGKSGQFTFRTNNGTGGGHFSNMVKQFTITPDGDVYLHDSSNGLIMKSSNGLCWKMTVNNSGNLVTQKVACP
jgi:hypothetical protein